ncbi:hypothetical protein [Nostoc sp.]|uniref:hypothetical protein n=1 Tax=Nostoc sp. TaxID=1180 RepID=UPI003FA60272
MHECNAYNFSLDLVAGEAVPVATNDRACNSRSLSRGRFFDETIVIQIFTQIKY